MLAVNIVKRAQIGDGRTGTILKIFGIAGPERVAINSPVSSGDVLGSAAAFSGTWTVSSALAIRKPTAFLRQISSLNVFGATLVMQRTASCQIETNLFFNGSPSFTAAKGQVLNISNALIIDGNVRLLVDLGPIPFNTSSIVVSIANFSRRSGQFSSVAIVPGARKRSIPVTENGVTCVATLGQPQQSYSSSSLSVTVSVTNVCAPTNGGSNINNTNTATSSSELSTGAIVGIAIGATVGGVVVALAIVLITKFLVAKYTLTQNAAIGMQSIQNLK